MKKQLLIFDFDGTIANTWQVAGRILEDVKDTYRLPPIDMDRLAELRGKSIKELLKISGLSWWQLPRFLNHTRKLFKVYIDEVPPIQGMPEAIRDLQSRGCKMGILTSNSEESVRTFLAKNNLEGFDFVLAPENLFGKAGVIKRILKYRKLNSQSVIMIGDEVRDINAATKAGIDSLAVSWGFNSEELLLSGCPTHLVRSPEEMLTYLQNAVLSQNDAISPDV
ncbi:MAG: HAD-IA family hydrolase [Bacteroidota bacterium]